MEETVDLERFYNNLTQSYLALYHECLIKGIPSKVYPLDFMFVSLGDLTLRKLEMFQETLKETRQMLDTLQSTLEPYFEGALPSLKGDGEGKRVLSCELTHIVSELGQWLRKEGAIEAAMTLDTLYIVALNTFMEPSGLTSLKSFISDIKKEQKKGVPNILKLTVELATEKDRAALAQHVLKSYFKTVESNPDEYIHQVFIAKEVFPHLFEKGAFSESCHLIVYDNGKVVATAGIVPETSPNTWKLVSVYVDDNYQGRGMATSMIKELIRIAKEKGATKITAFTLPNNMPVAYKLYLKLGFTLAKIIPGGRYKCTDRQDRDMIYHLYELQL